MTVLALHAIVFLMASIIALVVRDRREES